MLLLKSIIKNPDRSMLPGLRPSHLHSLSLRIWDCNPNTRIYVRLLGPCFKTGHLKPFRQHPKHIYSSIGRTLRLCSGETARDFDFLILKRAKISHKCGYFSPNPKPDESLLGCYGGFVPLHPSHNKRPSDQSQSNQRQTII